jgi:hypothetical protein
MAGGAMLGLRVQSLVVRCLDIAPDSWQRNAWIARPMAGGAMLGYRAR